MSRFGLAPYIGGNKPINPMSPKTRNILGWVLTILIAGFLLFSASGKFLTNEETQSMMAGLGITPETARMIGIIEIISTLLFVIPRTGVLGTLLLAAYLGGAIATHIEHPQAGPPTAAIIVQCVVWITAVIRFPELLWRITGRNSSASVSAAHS